MYNRIYQRLMGIGFVLSFCIGCDQITKRIAEKTLADSSVHSLFYDTVRIQHIQNKGAFLGFGSGFSEFIKVWLFLVLPIIFLLGAAIFVLFSPKIRNSQALLICLVVGGGIGNLIDRLLQGSVTDFLNVGIGPLRTGIFNVADMAIMAGAIGLILMELWSRSKASQD